MDPISRAPVHVGQFKHCPDGDSKGLSRRTLPEGQPFQPSSAKGPVAASDAPASRVAPGAGQELSRGDEDEPGLPSVGGDVRAHAPDPQAQWRDMKKDELIGKLKALEEVPPALEAVIASREQPAIFQSRDVWLRLLAKKPALYPHAPEGVQNDPEVIAITLWSDPKLIKQVSVSMPDDKALPWYAAVRKDPALRNVYFNRNNHWILQDDSAGHVEILLLPKIDRRICALANQLWLLRHPDLSRAELLNIISDKSSDLHPGCLEMIAEKFPLDAELWLAIIRRDEALFSLLPEEHRGNVAFADALSGETWSKIVKADWRALPFVPRRHVTRAMYDDALSAHPGARQFIPKRFLFAAKLRPLFSGGGKASSPVRDDKSRQ